MYMCITLSAFAGWAPFLFLDALRAAVRDGKGGVRAQFALQYSLRPVAGGDEADPALRSLAWRMALRNFAVLLPLTLVGSPILAALLPDAAVNWLEFVCQLPFVFVLDDLCFWAYHRALHVNKDWYTRFHKPHHIFTKPFAVVSHATHPVEMALQAVGALSGPLLLGMPRRAFWCWLVLRQWQGIEDHCGYELPFSPSAMLRRAKLPFAWALWGGGAFHDEHHAKFCGNYASVFPAIDWAFGTLLPTGDNGKKQCDGSICDG
jgi:sterol desaturase/sphingolipid hydroxylase (fatty acid hydroxylase superfamily)